MIGRDARYFPKPEIHLIEDHKRILHYLRKHGTVSRVDLSHALEINNGVVTRYSRELISLGLILESEQQKSPGRGRPSLPLHLCTDGAYAIGIAVNLGWVDLAVVNFAGQPVAQLSFEYEAASPQAFAVEVNRKLETLTRGLSLFRSKFLGFGLAVPGFAQYDAPSQRYTVERLSEWRGIDLSSIFADELAGPVWVENDANAAVLAEYYNGALHSFEDLMLIYLSYGVGGGAIVEGQLFRGGHLNAGEVGALYPLDKPRPSALDYVETLNKRLSTDRTLLNIRDEIDELDDADLDWISRAAEQLHLCVLSGICWFDPQAIVVSGTLPSQVIEAVTQHIVSKDWRKILGERSLPEVTFSSLGGASAAVGAAIVPMHETVSPLSRR